MAYYNTCSNCGAHLDPGEKCDCRKEVEENTSGKHLYLDEEEELEIAENFALGREE